ncbi:MAG TPA: DNA polymerase III subunit chi, partial [Candidatus Acidoferrum sp.]|nr:DNA polymerase III subunit chi [Candidatus Acidoferrum sp.]
MKEVRFHHLERRRVDEALPGLLERALEESRRVVVRASSEEMVAALNERLWTYDDAGFLPHGAAGDGDPMTQPIFLTTEVENPNAATMLIRLSSVEAG